MEHNGTDKSSSEKHKLQSDYVVKFQKITDPQIRMQTKQKSRKLRNTTFSNTHHLRFRSRTHPDTLLARRGSIRVGVDREEEEEDTAFQTASNTGYAHANASENANAGAGDNNSTLEERVASPLHHSHLHSEAPLERESRLGPLA